MIIITLTLGLVMAVFSSALIHYYQQGMANAFINHAKAIPSVWENGEKPVGNMENYSDAIIKNYQYKGAELQLLDLEGRLVQSSTGFNQEAAFQLDPDVLAYETVYRKETAGTGEKVLAVYIPLLYEGQTAGILRYVSSLSQASVVTGNLIQYGVLICLGVAAIVFLVSLHLAGSIVKPFQTMIRFTQEMAKGRFERRIAETYPHELGEMAAMLNYMADEIVKNERMKTDFISSISHELRTPLTGIKGWAETLETPEGLTEEEMQFGLRMIHSESQRLMHLVEDLLNFSKYESDRMTLSPSLFRIEQLLTETVLQLRQKADEKNIQIELETEPADIFADEDKIRQVLLNLIDNAIKFSNKRSTIQITQKVRNKTVFLRIRDFGIGIKKEHAEFIMDSFYKADAKAAGTGLGLAIARNIVQKHGGQIEIKSEFEQGTAVYVLLPLQTDQDEKNKQEE